MAGMAQAEGAGNGLGEHDSECAARTVSSVVALFMTKSLELDWPKLAETYAMVRQRGDSRGVGEPAHFDLFTENLLGEFSFVGSTTQVRRVFFSPTMLWHTSDDEGCGRDPNLGFAQQWCPKVFRLAQANEQDAHRLHSVVAEPQVAKMVQRGYFEPFKPARSKYGNVIKSAIQVLVGRQEKRVLMAFEWLAGGVFPGEHFRRNALVMGGDVGPIQLPQLQTLVDSHQRDSHHLRHWQCVLDERQDGAVESKAGKGEFG